MRFLLLATALFGLVACGQPKPNIQTEVGSCSLATTEQSCTKPAAEEATAEAKEFVEGRDYRLLEQPIAGAPDVIELFFYGCRACYYLTDDIANWSEKNNIQVSLVPAHTQEKLVDAARLYHTFAALQRLDLYVDGYVLFQEEGNDLQGKERIDALLKKRNVDIDQFWAAWSSDVVNQRLAGSYQLTSLAGVSTTPSFLVKGKYVVEFGVIESGNDVFPLLEHLLAKE